MKKSFIFVLIFVSIFLLNFAVFSQSTHTIGFESAEDGTGWEWTVSDNDDNPALEFIANPDVSEPNTSANVAKFTARLNGMNWALCFTNDDGEFTFDADNSTVKIMVHKSVISNVAIKFEGTSPAIELKVPNTLTDQWEELTFDFSAQIGNTYSRLVIIPDFVEPYVDGTDRTSENIIYFDNIQVPDGVLAGPLPEPAVAAPVPTHPASDVFSIYSDAYTNLENTNFNPGWGQATAQTFEEVGGDSVLKYAGLNYQGTNLGSTDGGTPQDVSGYDYLHLDFWTPNATALNFFIIDQTAGEVSYALPITTEEWISVDIPLSHFSDGGENLADIHQFKVDGGDGVSTVVYFDNWYFYKEGTVAGPDLFFSEYCEGSSNNKYVEIYNGTGADVDLSVYSIQGTNNGTSWGDNGERDTSLTGTLAAGDVYVIAADEADSVILAQTDLALPYESPLHYNGDDGIALLKNGVIIDVIGVENADPGTAWDVSGVTNATKDHTLVRKNSVTTGNTDWASSAGTNADDSEWIVLEIDDFSNLGIHGGSSTPTEPEEAAPAPAVAADKVISLFSDAYTNVTVDTWSAVWDQADVATMAIQDDSVKLYTNLNYAGIEFTSETIDVSSMTHFHMDIWTPDSTDLPKVFKIKLVDFGADGAWSGGDDVEHEIIVDANSGLMTVSWVSLDIPMTDFVNLTTTEHLAQLIISGDPNTVYVDNIYFYTTEVAPTEPTVAAPEPTEDPEKVISLFSDAYSNIVVDTWSAGWDQADFTSLAIEGDSVKFYSNLGYAGIEFTSQTIDASSMTHFHMDIWTPDSTALPRVFKIKLVDFGADGAWSGGDDVEHEVSLDANAGLMTGSWVSFDIPLSEFVNLTTKEHLAQLIISGDMSSVYVDNIYLYDTSTSIEYVDGLTPLKYELGQNYPNPFNPSTKIRFSLPQANHVTIKVFNLLGQEVASVLNEFKNAGTYELNVDGSDLPSGVYLYSISAGNFVSVKKMVLIK